LYGTVDGGRRLTEDEQVGILVVMFLAGLDTTRGAITTIAYHVAKDPTLEARLRDPRWARRDLDEFLRLESPVGCLARRVTKDTELGGVRLSAGAQLLLRFDSANRDPRKFVDPDQLNFNVRRGGHTGFGLGLHRCIGALLARMQIQVAFHELFKRVTNLRLGEESDMAWMPGIANGPESLALTFDRVPDRS
jgi:cytochrome P450